jgi:hypothetical protein
MKLIDLKRDAKDKESTGIAKSIKDSPDYGSGTRLTLDKDHIAKLGVGHLNVGDECHVMGHCKVTSKSSHERDQGDAHQSIEMQIIKMGVGPVEAEKEAAAESMKDYAKRRNAEIRER